MALLRASSASSSDNDFDLEEYDGIRRGLPLPKDYPFFPILKPPQLVYYATVVSSTVLHRTLQVSLNHPKKKHKSPKSLAESGLKEVTRISTYQIHTFLFACIPQPDSPTSNPILCFQQRNQNQRASAPPGKKPNCFSKAFKWYTKVKLLSRIFSTQDFLYGAQKLKKLGATNGITHLNEGHAYLQKLNKIFPKVMIYFSFSADIFTKIFLGIKVACYCSKIVAHPANRFFFFGLQDLQTLYLQISILSQYLLIGTYLGTLKLSMNSLHRNDTALKVKVNVYQNLKTSQRLTMWSALHHGQTPSMRSSFGTMASNLNIVK